MEVLRFLLYPFAAVYGIVTGIRNFLFNCGILRGINHELPVIVVGNLSTGGTGKTPHVEYLIRLLSGEFRVNTLSRGYGRRTRGYIRAGADSDSSVIGDEPMQYYRKFSGTGVNVDSDRNRGIREICKQDPETGVILLDDAFQHRYVKAGLSILLTDYHKPYFRDYLLPVGSLREVSKGARRADIVIVTKTPRVLSPIVKRQMLSDIRPRAGQSVYFSFINYGEIISLWDGRKIPPGKKFSAILLFAGIANTYPIEEYLYPLCHDLTIVKFADHHPYSENDLDRIKRNFDDLYGPNKLLVTTEKDAMRLLQPKLCAIAQKLPVYYLPMEVEFHGEDKQAFDEQILNYVRTNQRER